MRWWVLGLLPLAGMSMATQTNCVNKQTETDQLICSTPSLNTMEDVVESLYNRALEGPDSLRLLDEQQVWVDSQKEHCHDKSSCEQFFITRINQLLNQITQHPVMSLETNMTLPDVDQLDSYSKDGLALVGAEHYQPWKRRSLLSKEFVASRPIAKVIGEDVYVFYKVTTDNYRDAIYELNLKSLYKHVVVQGKNYNIALSGDNLVIEVEPSGQNATEILKYRIGSRTAPVADATMAEFNDELTKGRTSLYRRWALSHDGKKIALTISDLQTLIHDTTLSETVKKYLTAIVDKLDKDTLQFSRTIVVYDSQAESVHIMPDILDGSETREWWKIYDIAWSEDDRTLYFDNEGQRFACIWTFDMTENQVTKIVPEHTAISAFPFMYQGKSHIVYILGNGSDAGQLMLAAPAD
ncbi:hypothetical protein OAP63_06400 [Vibrio sp.]|nr:hypothetical protein [Vibrio sp.]